MDFKKGDNITAVEQVMTKKAYYLILGTETGDILIHEVYSGKTKRYSKVHPSSILKITCFALEKEITLRLLSSDDCGGII